jgi:NAD+ diphosphatase
MRYRKMTKNHSGNIPGQSAVFSSAFLVSRYPEPETPPKDAKWVIVRENGVYVQAVSPPVLFFSGTGIPPAPAVQTEQYLGHHGTRACYAAEVAPGSVIPGCTFYPNVRELYGIIPEQELAMASLAVRIIDFNRTTLFCGQCGAHTRQSRQERAKICDTCGLVTYPRTSPAVIVLVQRDDRILLARSPRFPSGLYSIIAGFVETNETLEEAVHREVREETGIEIANIRYLGSEPWPFPNSLMIGFIADFAGGEITIDHNEIVSAGWFDRDHLPNLPSNMSISRAIIGWWVSGGDRNGS